MNQKFAAHSFYALLLANLLVGCSTAASTSTAADSMQDMNLKSTSMSTIDFSTDPAVIHVGDAVHLKELVSNQKKDIVDASVTMEIWHSDDARHDNVKATPDSKGNYVVNYVFKKNGTYHITLHTTTDEMHQMPTKVIQVNP